MTTQEYEQWKCSVYEYYFRNDRKWTFPGQVVFYNGARIHYSDFMKAKRGTL